MMMMMMMLMIYDTIALNEFVQPDSRLESCKNNCWINYMNLNGDIQIITQKRQNTWRKLRKQHYRYV